MAWRSGLVLRSLTTDSPPVAGTWVEGTVVIGQNGTIAICTASGTPGTWVSVSGGSGIAESLATAAHQILRSDGSSSWTVSNIGEEEIVCRLTSGVVDGLSVAASRIVGRKSSGSIDDLTAAEVKAIVVPPARQLMRLGEGIADTQNWSSHTIATPSLTTSSANRVDCFWIPDDSATAYPNGWKLTLIYRGKHQTNTDKVGWGLYDLDATATIGTDEYSSGSGGTWFSRTVDFTSSLPAAGTRCALASYSNPGGTGHLIYINHAELWQVPT